MSDDVVKLIRDTIQNCGEEEISYIPTDVKPLVLSPSTNPWKDTIHTLDDVAGISKLSSLSVDVLRKHMVCDPGHDEGHITRVVRHALWFGYGGDLEVIVPAAILHDLVNVPKDNPNRSLASKWSALKAIEELKALGWVGNTLHQQLIRHAITAHSWSAKVTPETYEAKAVQDADRIESLGYIGIARLFAVGGSFRAHLFHPTDPLAKDRELDEKSYTLDHYFIKLRHLADTMHTVNGKREALRLTEKMQAFVESLAEEIC